MVEFKFTELLPTAADQREYRLITTDGVEVVDLAGRKFLSVKPEVIEQLTYAAIKDTQHLLRTDHLASLRKILDDPAASPNDRFVALDLLKNANISAGGVLPMCQDTGTMVVSGKRGSAVLTTGQDEAVIAKGIFNVYQI